MTRAAALRTLATGLELALRGVRELLEAPDPDEWVEQERSPLGQRRHCELARDGKFPSARKRDGHWYVRRRELDAYIEGGTPPEPRESDSEAAEMAEILGFRAPPRRRKAG